jgi:hypothetical protein
MNVSHIYNLLFKISCKSIRATPIVLLFMCIMPFSTSKCEQVIISDADSVSRKEPAERYTFRTTGLSMLTFRDFATSPLFYRGGGLNLAYGRLNQKSHREFYYEFDFLAANTSALAPESNYFQTNTGSLYFSLSGYYHYLHVIKALSTEKNRLMLGAAYVSTQNIRLNQQFQNAAAGLENIMNLMISARYTRDFSRKESKELQYYKLKIKLPRVQRSISFQLNTGLLNFNRRPGYAYVYSNAWDGSNTNGLNWILEEYKLSMNGWRFGTRLEFLRKAENRNTRRIAYIWDIAHVPGRFDVFQMAIHRLQFTTIIHKPRRKR